MSALALELDTTKFQVLISAVCTAAVFNLPLPARAVSSKTDFEQILTVKDTSKVAIAGETIGNYTFSSKDPLELVLDQVFGLSRTQDNWNGRGAEVPSNSAIRQGVEVVRKLAAYGLFPKEVSPSAEGGVALVFESTRNKYADIECFNTGEIVAGYTNRRSIFEARDVLDINAQVEDIAKFIRDFINVG